MTVENDCIQLLPFLNDLSPLLQQVGVSPATVGGQPNKSEAHRFRVCDLVQLGCIDCSWGTFAKIRIGDSFRYCDLVKYLLL